jgi:hypothetical protein
MKEKKKESDAIYKEIMDMLPKEIEPKTPEEIREEQEFRGALLQDGIKNKRVAFVVDGKEVSKDDFRLILDKCLGRRK